MKESLPSVWRRGIAFAMLDSEPPGSCRSPLRTVSDDDVGSGERTEERPDMYPPETVHRVAIIGTGTIGASWATHYLARGFHVTASDPAPQAEEALRSFIAAAWDTVTKLGLSAAASPDRLRFTRDIRQAVADADFVQENAPERPELKVKLFAEIDDAAPPEVIIASSSSGIKMSVIQAECRHPERTIIAHPFNPPHIIPLVEVVGGTKTAPQTIRDAIAFYQSIGKRPIHVKKEIPGHAVNRIQAALYREVVHLIDQGVLDVADSDDAVSWGPGLRWGIMGQNRVWHLGGGRGGIQYFMNHLMPLVAKTLWSDLGSPELTPQLQETIVNGILEEVDGHSIDELAAQRDAILCALLSARAQHAAFGSKDAMVGQPDIGSPVDYQRSRWSTWSRGSRGAGRNVSPV